ncbi:MAG: hypothetical protein AAF961_15305 [Planctomycetota bacterium]
MADSRTHRGIVHGQTIELTDPTDLPSGQQVKIIVQPVTTRSESKPSGEGIQRSAGAWADDAAQLDEYLEWNGRQREIGRSFVEE